MFWVAANTKGHMRLIDGDKEILPGIRVYTGGRHTFASQYVAVDTKNGGVVLASDNVYLYENLDKHLPIAQTWDEKSNLAAQDKMKTLVKDQRFIVPGHHPISDNVYLYENLDKHLPIAQTWDEKSNLAAQDKMKTLVKDQRFIVPGHDPQVMTRD